MEEALTSTAATFDYTSSDVEGPEFWDAVAELQRRGPLVWVESLGGYWAATSQDLILRIAQDWQTFSNNDGVALGRPSFEQSPRIVPLEIDPPKQRAYRRQVNPTLTVKALSGLDQGIRDIANELIDTFIDQGSCDLAVDFARKFPGTVFFRLVAHSTDEEFRKAEPAARMISFESDDPEKFAAGAAQLSAWAQRMFDSRANCPRPEPRDVVDATMHLEESGEQFFDYEHRSGLQVLAQGGIGTSASAIGSIMLMLCRDRELQAQVRADHSLIPRVVEETIRLESPVPLMFRTATRDVDLAGQRIKKGDKVCLIFGAAGRDPEVFEHADQFDLDRPHCRHIGFGAGVHRCIGSNLARLQIRIAVEQLVTRLADFWVPEGAEITYASRQARGPSSIPLKFTAA